MHASVLEWFETMPRWFFTGKNVLEAGSYDENGSVRSIIERHDPASYLGIDPRSGPGVDLEFAVEDFTPDADFDVVVSTEMLEHAPDWRAALTSMKRLLAPRGLLIITTRSPGFPHHAYPDDHWRFTIPMMAAALMDMAQTVIIPDPDPASPGLFALANAGDEWPPGFPMNLDGFTADPAPPAPPAPIHFFEVGS